MSQFETMENKIKTKDKIETQDTYSHAYWVVRMWIIP